MKIRPAYVADQFYPGDPRELRSTVERCITTANIEARSENVACLVVPHAGYIFSGPTAGHGYKRIRGASPSRVVLLGVSHHYRFDGIALYTGDAFDTPLGRLMIDRDFSDELASRFPCNNDRPHEHEHTLETQLPFVQIALGNVPIVPILFGAYAGRQHVEFGKQLAAMLAPDDLVIASTDLSHFLPEEEANAIDHATIECILAGDLEQLIRELSDEACSMCGAAAVVAALSCAAARGARQRRLLDYRTSAAVSGDYGRVVGYAALSMEYKEAS